MDDKIIEILNNINFTNRYIVLCNRFSDYNNGLNFTKQEMLAIIDKSIQLEFSSKEKVFFKDYLIKNFNVRFLLGYKYGFIDCRYWISEGDETIMNGSFREIALMEDKEFNEKVSYRFPIATSIDDLKYILNKITSLNDEFINNLILKLNPARTDF